MDTTKRNEIDRQIACLNYYAFDTCAVDDQLSIGPSLSLCDHHLRPDRPKDP